MTEFDLTNYACQICGAVPKWKIQISGGYVKIVAWSCPEHLVPAFHRIKPSPAELGSSKDFSWSGATLTELGERKDSAK